jgi:hypothetical protein
MHEVVWREATTLEMFRLSTGQDAPSSDLISALQEKFGFQLNKPRPWGLVIQPDGVAALAYSRTSDNSKSKSETVLDHSLHHSDCYLEKDGRIECLKRFLIRSKAWNSPRDKLNIQSMQFRLMCFCDKKSCSIEDKKFVIALKNLGKDRPYIVRSDALGSRTD